MQGIRPFSDVMFSCSSAAPLFLGTDGLTDTKKARLAELVERHKNHLNETDPKLRKKYELTANMKAEVAELDKELQDFKKGIIKLPAGAKTYIESKVDEVVYNYKPSFAQTGNIKTNKGNLVEDEAIELINRYFMKDYVKSASKLQKGRLKGHPDIEDEEDEMIVDNKSSWTKETFPKTPDKISNSTYEWQGKLYCYLKGWRKYRLIYTLISTPESLVPDYEGDDLHYADDLPIGLRLTWVDYTLSDDEIAHIERRLAAAEIYAAEYYNKLISKIN
jgi:hypothetical protein